jgi:mono/diheme cytochrome c family protein
VYIDNCAACHRTDGQGYTRVFPALAGNPVVQTADATSLIHVVLAGRHGAGDAHRAVELHHAGFGWRLSDQEVAEVVNFIRTSWGNRAPGG